MIKTAVLFLAIALVLAILGFGGVVSLAIGFVKILSWIAVATATILLILGLTMRRTAT